MNKNMQGMALCAALLISMHATAAPKNIILFIGDGMGPSQLTAAHYTKGELNMARCPVGGLMTTYAANNFITDSAASGTALATGFKTSVGTIAQTPEGQPLKTALEVAEDVGKATGLVATSAITHATPATFSTHVPARKMQNEIAEQLAAQEIEVLLGGGLAFFTPQTEKGSMRSDDQDLFKVLESKMTVVTNQAGFDAAGTPDRLAGLFAPVELPKVSEGRISLAAMTEKAIDILQQDEQGFFLMVEASQIDWGGHANDEDYVITETVDFDDAVGVGLDFAKKDGETLIIITADHETGGFSVLEGSVAEKTITKTAFTSGGHSASMVPIFAYGPGAEVFGGIKDNTDVGRQLIKYLTEDRPGFFKRLFH